MALISPPPRKVRDTNLELFRIVLMLAIIMHHYVVNSGLFPMLLNTREELNSRLLLFLGAWGKTGINCFVLITGYFMCKSQISVEKFLKLFLEVIFYLLVFNTVFFLSGYVPLSLGNLFRGFIGGDISHSFWKTYLVFFLCIPFWNILISNLSKRHHLLFLFLLLGWFSILPSLNGRFNVVFNYVSWFGVVYLLGAYIRLYSENLFKTCWLWGIISVVLIGFGCLSIIYYPDVYFFVSDSNKLLAVAISVALFLFFKNLSLPCIPAVYWFSQTIFGVLLIHANSDFMRKWLWVDVLKNTSMLSSPWLWIHVLGSVIGIFVICSYLDHLRIRFVEKQFMVILSKFEKKYCGTSFLKQRVNE